MQLIITIFEEALSNRPMDGVHALCIFMAIVPTFAAAASAYNFTRGIVRLVTGR